MSGRADPLSLLAQGNQAYNRQEFATAASCYEQAIEAAKEQPRGSFDSRAFVAECNAGLSGAYQGMSKLHESLACAEEALEFFDRFGAFYPTSWRPQIVALLNKGVSLANLKRSEEGLKALQRAKTLLESLGNNQLVTVYLSSCEEAIKAIQVMQAAENTTRKWWEFWK